MSGRPVNTNINQSWHHAGPYHITPAWILLLKQYTLSCFFFLGINVVMDMEREEFIQEYLLTFCQKCDKKCNQKSVIYLFGLLYVLCYTYNKIFEGYSHFTEITNLKCKVLTEI